MWTSTGIDNIYTTRGWHYGKTPTDAYKNQILEKHRSGLRRCACTIVYSLHASFSLYTHTCAKREQSEAFNIQRSEVRAATRRPFGPRRAQHITVMRGISGYQDIWTLDRKRGW